MTNQKETYLLQANKPGGHVHTAQLGPDGDGLSSIDAEHAHQIRLFVVNTMPIPTSHTHTLVRAPPQI